MRRNAEGQSDNPGILDAPGGGGHRVAVAGGAWQDPQIEPETQPIDGELASAGCVGWRIAER
jgi:hypothetical protein